MKKQQIHIERDKEGNIVNITKEGDEDHHGGTPNFDMLMKKFYEEHPEEKPSAKVKAGLKKAGKMYFDISKRFVEAQGMQNMYNPAASRGKPGMKKDKSLSKQNTNQQNQMMNPMPNPFMRNPFYNPFVLLHDDKKKKKSKK